MSKKHQKLEDILKEIEKNNYITVEQYDELKYYSVQPGGFSAKNKKSNENQKIIFKALLNMQNSRDDTNFIKNTKKHPSKIISDNFKDGLENKNSSNEIIVVNKDISRNIFFQWKENDKEIDYELNEFEKQIENYLKENKDKYSYYQGYLDFCVFFYVLFHDKNKENIEYINIIQFFTELYLKDYISPFKSIGGTEDVIFQNGLSLLIDIIKLLDINIYQIFKEESTPLCLILSWTISLFSHSINNFYTLRRILDYLLINEPINSYILTAIIIVKSLQKNIKNILEAESEDIFLTIKEINLDKMDFDNLIIQCETFYKNNLEEILKAQDKNKNSLLLLGDYNYRGVENVVYSYNNQKLMERNIEKKSFIISYQFIFILFLTWIFVIYFFHKDTIIERLNENIDNNLNNDTKLKLNNYTNEDEEF